MIIKIGIFILFMYEWFKLDKAADNNNIAGVVKGIFFWVLYMIIFAILNCK